MACVLTKAQSYMISSIAMRAGNPKSISWVSIDIDVIIIIILITLGQKGIRCSLFDIDSSVDLIGCLGCNHVLIIMSVTAVND